MHNSIAVIDMRIVHIELTNRVVAPWTVALWLAYLYHHEYAGDSESANIQNIMITYWAHACTKLCIII